MMRNFITIYLMFLSMQAYSRVEIKDVFFSANEQGKFSLNLVTEGDSNIQSNISTRENILQVEIQNSIVWPKISKKIKISREEIEIMAYQFDKNNVRVRVVYPNEKQLSDKDVKIENQNNKVTYSGNLFGSTNETVVKDKYDESYLEKLLQEKETIEEKVALDQMNQKNEKIDSVNLRYSSPLKNKENKKFSIWSYTGKFIGFLLLIIGGIYGVFYGLKKGALKKNKLSFLSSDKHIEVVSKHYLSPKRNLMIVRVQNQAFLLAGHETGIEFLSELNEPGKLFKNFELEVTGDNFSQNLDRSNDLKEFGFNLKENINESKPEETESSLSQKVKNKLKNMRDIQ